MILERVSPCLTVYVPVLALSIVCVWSGLIQDSKGERHGSQAERMLAASNAAAVRFKPNTLFASGEFTSYSLGLPSP